MKTIIIFFLVSLVVLAQPKSTIVSKVKAPLAGRTYLVFADVKTTNTSSVLVEDMDYKNPDVTSYIKTLLNVHTVGDTLFGEFDVPIIAQTQYVKGGVVTVNSTTQRYSPMKTTAWLTIGAGESKPQFFIIQEK